MKSHEKRNCQNRKSSAAQRGRVMRVCCCTSLSFCWEKQSRNQTNSNAENEKREKQTQPNPTLAPRS
jgi:hypothetical protein